MKRIKLALIILAIILVVATGIFGVSYYFKDKSEKEAKAEEDKLTMFEFNEDDVKKIEINNESGQYVLEYISGKGWQLTNTDEFTLNDTIAASIVAKMSELKAIKILDDTDKSKYGFDNPTKITSYIDDTEYTIYVGDTTPTYENFYAMKENDDKIYLIEYASGIIFDSSKDNLKDVSIYNYLSYDVDHFALWKGAETDENVLFSIDMDNEGNWTMEKPSKGADVDLVQIDEFLTDSAKDEIYSFVQENCSESDYSKYGFDDPQYVFEISSGDDTTKVIFGDETSEGEIYGLFTKNGQVVKFIPSEISLLNYSTLDIMETSVFSSDIDSVNEVEVTISGKTMLMDMSAGETAYKLDDVNVSEFSEEAKSAFISFYDSFNNSYFESEAKDASPSGDAEVVVKYALKSNVVTVIEYIPVPDSDEYYVMKDGKYTGFTVIKEIVDNINKAYNNLTDTIK